MRHSHLLAFVLGFMTTAVLATCDISNAADRMPGEWMDDNVEYGEAIVFDRMTVEEVLEEINRGNGATPYNGTMPNEGITFTLSDTQTIDIDNLLTRCLEFLRDGDIDQNKLSWEYAIYRPHTLKSDALDAVEAAQNELARLEKETQLRRDIEGALAALRGAK